MREYDYVEVIVEKEKYAKEGVHKGMRGTILDPRNIEGCWLVYFSDPVTHADTIGIPIKEVDLKVVQPAIEYDKVRLINDNEKYLSHNVHKGMVGELWKLGKTQSLLIFEDRTSFYVDNEDFEIIEKGNVDYERI